MLTLSTTSDNKRSVSKNEPVYVAEDIESYTVNVNNIEDLLGSKLITNRFVVTDKDLEIGKNKCFVINKELSFEEDYKLVLNDNSNIKFLNMNI